MYAIYKETAAGKQIVAWCDDLMDWPQIVEKDIQICDDRARYWVEEEKNNAQQSDKGEHLHQ